jgi:hypothetical protein
MSQPGPTGLYDRRIYEVSLDEVERIGTRAVLKAIFRFRIPNPDRQDETGTK